jgi:uncharacterized cupredoxin-like copper-binding protein
MFSNKLIIQIIYFQSQSSPTKKLKTTKTTVAPRASISSLASQVTAKKKNGAKSAKKKVSPGKVSKIKPARTSASKNKTVSKKGKRPINIKINAQSKKNKTSNLNQKTSGKNSEKKRAEIAARMLVLRKEIETEIKANNSAEWKIKFQNLLDEADYNYNIYRNMTEKHTEMNKQSVNNYIEVARAVITHGQYSFQHVEKETIASEYDDDIKKVLKESSAFMEKSWKLRFEAKALYDRNNPKVTPIKGEDVTDNADHILTKVDDYTLTTVADYETVPDVFTSNYDDLSNEPSKEPEDIIPDDGDFNNCGVYC